MNEPFILIITPSEVNSQKLNLWYNNHYKTNLQLKNKEGRERASSEGQITTYEIIIWNPQSTWKNGTISQSEKIQFKLTLKNWIFNIIITKITEIILQK